MAREKLKSLVTSFTTGGEYLAVLSPDGTVRVSSLTLHVNESVEFVLLAGNIIPIMFTSPLFPFSYGVF